MAVKKHPDYFLLGVVLILLALGMLILASVSAPFSQQKFGNTFYFLNHQLLFGLVPGLILGYFAFRINLSFLKKWSPVLLLSNVFLMILVFLPFFGSEKGGASRWINIGSFSFQPGELLKLVFILYLATWISSRMEKVKNSKDFSRTLISFLFIIALISLLLILQPNVSTLCVIASVSLLMYFSVDTPVWHTFLIVLLGISCLFLLMKFEPYRASRLIVFLNPETDPMGIGYQLKQALIAVGSGGLKGVGLGMSTQRYGFLPQSIADSIFAVFSEETGFVGASALIILFLTFAWCGFKIAKSAKDTFCQLTALGITSWIIIQSFVNIGAMIGILPLTGIPLPFISYGGSALITELMGLGILLNISRQNA